MKQVDITSETLSKAELSYIADSDFDLDTKAFESKEGITLSIFVGLSSANHTSINNYSNLT